MEQMAHRLYASLFILLILVLGLFSLSALNDFDNRDSVERGEVALEGAFNGDWAAHYESHYNENFPVKTLGTSLWAAIQYLVFDEGREGVVVGEDDWLYTQEEFKAYGDFNGNVEDRIKFIEKVARFLSLQDVTLVLSLVPAKARVYSEFLGSRRPYVSHLPLYKNVIGRLVEADIYTVELLSVLTEEKEYQPVFLRTDTHWSPAGADKVAKELVKTLKINFPDLPWGSKSFETVAIEEILHEGDLFSFLPLEPYFDHLGPPKEILVKQRTVQKSDDDEGGLFGDDSASIALVGTSYSANSLWNFVGALQQQAGLDIVNYAQEGKGPVIPMVEYLLSQDFHDEPPQVLIWEFPERYLPMPYDLSQYDLPFD